MNCFQVLAIFFTIILSFLKIDVCNSSETELSQSGPSTISLRAGWHPQFYRIVLEGDEEIVAKGHVKQNEKDITISFDNARIDVERKYTPFAYKANSDGVVVSLPKKGEMTVYSLSGPSRLVVDVYPPRNEQKPKLTKRRRKANIPGAEQNKAVGPEDADKELSEGKQIVAHQRAMEDDRFKVVEKTDAEGDTGGRAPAIPRTPEDDRLKVSVKGDVGMSSSIPVQTKQRTLGDDRSVLLVEKKMQRIAGSSYKQKESGRKRIDKEQLVEERITLNSTQTDYQHRYEKNLTNKIISILEPVVGKGKVKARVSASFGLTQSEWTEETFDPDGVVDESEQKSSEKTISGSSGAGDVPSVTSNMPGSVGPGRGSSSQGQSQKEDEMINYEKSKTVTGVVESPASLDRLSVAIIIDGIYAFQNDSVKNIEKNDIRSEADVNYYEDIVKKTIGFDYNRGDEISVMVMPFKDIKSEEIGGIERDIIPIANSILRYVALLLVALIFFFIVLRPMIKSLSKTPSPVSQTRMVDAPDSEFVCKKAMEKISSRDISIHGEGEEYEKKILTHGLENEDAERIMEMVGKESPLDSLKWVDALTLSNFLLTEHPQTIALILCLLQPEQAAEVMELLPEDLRGDVSIRVAETQRIPQSALEEIEEVLKVQLDIKGSSEGKKFEGTKVIADILNHCDRSTEQNILEKVELQNSELSESIRELMLVFEDLEQIEDRGIQMILKDVSTEELSLALKTASDSIKNKIFNNMSQREVKLLKEDMEAKGTVKLSDVEAAQQNIVRIAKKKDEEGQIIIAGRVGRNSLLSRKILNNSEATLYSMPTLEEDRSVFLQSIDERQRLGYKEGFAAGEKAGFREGEEKAAVLIERLSSVITEITTFRENLIKKTEAQIVELSSAIARKIISEEITVKPEIILSIVRNALKTIQRKGTITIKINPALHELFSRNHASLLGIHDDIIFDANEKIPVTGPLVISQNEEVETDLNVMVANIVEQIREIESGSDQA